MSWVCFFGTGETRVSEKDADKRVGGGGGDALTEDQRR